MNKIDKTDSLTKILSHRRFTVDVFQREYRWGRKQIEQMLSDFQDTFEEFYDPNDHDTPEEVENYGYYYMNTYYPSIIIQQTDEQGIKHAHIDFLYVMLFLVLIGLFVLLTLLWNLKNKNNILLLGLLIPVALSLSFKVQDNALVSLLFNIGFYVTVTFLTLLYNIKTNIQKNKVINLDIILKIKIIYGITFQQLYYGYQYYSHQYMQSLDIYILYSCSCQCL